MQAFADGEEIQIRSNSRSDWYDVNEPKWQGDPSAYRIKPIALFMPPEGELHNPDNLTGKEVGKNRRLLSKHEFELLKKGDFDYTIRVWNDSMREWALPFLGIVGWKSSRTYATSRDNKWILPEKVKKPLSLEIWNQRVGEVITFHDGARRLVTATDPNVKLVFFGHISFTLEELVNAVFSNGKGCYDGFS